MSDAIARIPVGDRYDVVVGNDILAGVADAVPAAATRVLLVHSGSVPAVVASVSSALSASGRRVVEVVVPDAEAAKTATVAGTLWARLGQEGFTRSDAVVGVGGGAVTDLAGFVAASWLRGVPVVQVPTTLLAMVDAAVGGKTGINTAEGKNLVGAFHEPAAVLCDVQTLNTLPRKDFAAGSAEIIKAGFIADPRILTILEDDPAAGVAVGPRTLELIERSIAVKARVVGEDLKEAGLREILNYGHTLGHAIEQFEGYRMRHGEAVSIGMVFAAELASGAGLLDPSLVEQHRSVLRSVGLPTTYSGATLDQLLAAMGRDKKARGNTMRFVVLTGLAQPTILTGPDPGLLRAAFATLSD